MQPIVFIIGSLNIGGAEKHVSQIAPALLKKGYDVSIISLSPPSPGDFTEDLIRQGITIKSPPSVWVFAKLPRLMRGSISLVMRFIWLTQQLASQRHSILHFFLPQAYCLGMASSTLLVHKGPRILSRRSLNDYQKKRPILTFFERHFHRYITHATGNSKKVVQQLIQEGIPANKVKLIYNGIDLASFGLAPPVVALRNSLTSQPDTLFLVLVANLIPYKGHADLISALASIKDKITRPWQLLCLGRDDGIQKKLELAAQQQGIAAHIQWLGSQKNVAEFLSISDIGLLCSHEEGFSNAILECMAAKLPMIVTDVGGNAEAVADGISGYVVPPKCPEKLGATILELIMDKEKRQQFGSAGYARVQQLFSLASIVEKYQRFYAEVAKQSQSSRLTDHEHENNDF